MQKVLSAVIRDSKVKKKKGKKGIGEYNLLIRSDGLRTLSLNTLGPYILV